MGFLKRLFGGAEDREESAGALDPWEQRPSWMVDGMSVSAFDGDCDLEVVGESKYQDALWKVVGGWRNERVDEDVQVLLIPQVGNPHDENAVGVWVVGGGLVGYLSREFARAYRPGIERLQREHGPGISLYGRIVGGGMRDDGPGRLGVFLRHDPGHFGLSRPGPEQRRQAPPDGAMRTGLSEAWQTDLDDDGYDLEWMDRIPDDGTAAIRFLRGLLEHDPDPIDRHFQFAELESRLYKARDAFASALDDYDAVAEAHDAEMDGIRAAFVEKWGKVPLLETYRQCCVRQAKAKNYERGLWWAERGLAVYGDDANRPENVEDLRKRAEDFRSKLSAPAPTPRTPRAPRPAAEPTSAMETLVCMTCGATFERARTRGRKPHECPSCRGATVEEPVPSTEEEPPEPAAI